jgi:hypothetical protein
MHSISLRADQQQPHRQAAACGGLSMRCSVGGGDAARLSQHWRRDPTGHTFTTMVLALTEPNQFSVVWSLDRDSVLIGGECGGDHLGVL